MIPNMSLWRPCDSCETAVAWKAALERQNGPTSLVFTRQGLAPQPRDAEQIASIARGGYVLSDSDSTPELIIIATGSEVQLAMDVKNALGDANVIRVVSMPSTDVFDAQDQSYRDAVLPPSVRQRVVIEAGVGDGWYRYCGADGLIIGMTSFGESAPAPDLFKHFGFTVESVVGKVKAWL